MAFYDMASNICQALAAGGREDRAVVPAGGAHRAAALRAARCHGGGARGAAEAAADAAAARCGDEGPHGLAARQTAVCSSD
jgi:hypothetical protein